METKQVQVRCRHGDQAARAGSGRDAWVVV